MINLEKIKEIRFDYFDENEYVYNFEMLKNRTEKISDNEYRFYLICKNTNVSANGEVFLDLKVEDKEVTFKTDYFANSFDYIKLQKEEKSTESNSFYSVCFGNDTLEIEVIY